MGLTDTNIVTILIMIVALIAVGIIGILFTKVTNLNAINIRQSNMIDDLDEKNFNLDLEYRVEKEKANSLLNENIRLQGVIKSLNDNEDFINIEHSKEISEKNTELKAVRTKLENLVKDNDKVKKELDLISDNLRVEEKHNVELKYIIDTLNDTIKELNSKVDTLENDLKLCKKENAGLKGSKTKLLTKLERLQKSK